MDIEPNDPESREIARLILEEEKTALDEFRRRDFGRRMRARIGQITAETRRPLLARRWAVSVGVGIVLLAAAWAFLLMRPSPRPAAGGGPGSFLAGLRSLPGLMERASRTDRPESRGLETPGLRDPLGDALVRARQRTAEKDVASGPPRPGIRKVPRLSLEQKMKILFKDKVIERVLVVLQKKSEEV